MPLPTLSLPDGSSVAAASSLQGLAAEQQRAAAVTAGAAAQEGVSEFVPGPGYALEELRFMELDVRTFSQGKDAC